MTSDMRDIDS